MKEKIFHFFQIFSPLILGSLVGFVIKDFMDYSSLNQPPFAPPGIVFPIAWTALYLLMGTSYYFYRKTDKNSTLITLYYIQLFLNLTWTFIFFVFKMRFLAIVWILVIILLVFYLIKQFWNIKKESAYLLIPYLLWLLFAMYLTIGIFLLN